jgi:hypothetical protein
MVCEKYVARINIWVQPHHEEPMNLKNYFSFMTFFLDPHVGYFCCGHDRSWAHHNENMENGQEWLFFLIFQGNSRGMSWKIIPSGTLCKQGRALHRSTGWFPRILMKPTLCYVWTYHCTWPSKLLIVSSRCLQYKYTANELLGSC